MPDYIIERGGTLYIIQCVDADGESTFYGPFDVRHEAEGWDEKYCVGETHVHPLLPRSDLC